MSSIKWVELEDIIKKSGEAYEKKGILKIKKVSPPTAVIYKKGKPEVIHQRNPFVDFIGCFIQKGSRMIHIEAKHYNKDRLPVNRKGGITPNQCTSLQSWYEAGCIVGAIWQKDREFFWLGIDLINDCINEDRASVKPEECEPIEIWKDRILIFHKNLEKELEAGEVLGVY